MKVLISNATREDNPAALKAIDKLFTVSEPLGMAYLAAVLKKEGIDVEILDCLALNYKQKNFEDFIKSKKYDIIGISTYTPDWHVTKNNLDIIKKNSPETVVIVGGPHINSLVRANLAKELFDDCQSFDFAVYGEGEITLLELVRAIEKKSDTSQISGIVFKKSDGQICVNPKRDLIKDINNIPFPALELMPLEKYSRTPSSYKREPVRSILTTRGCPFSCVFCDRGAFGRSLRRRNIDNIMAEVARLVTEFKTRELRIWDDVFTSDEKFTLEICKELKKYNLLWSCNARVNMVKPNVLKAMKEAGCWAVDFGIESGNNRVLKAIDKKFTVKEAKESIKMVKESGIEVRTFFILGLPQETLESMQDTINFALSGNIDYATFYLPQAYKGTRLYEIARQEGALETDYSKYLITGKEASYINKNIGLENMQIYQRQAYRDFYRRPSYVLKMILKIRSLEDIKRYFKAVHILGV